MVKKIKKYLKFVVCCALILSLIAPSYAALSASDGSAFVTKAEFDSALADFNARLTTFEAGINSKIDSQVTSYLDRNGIWNGMAQPFINANGKINTTLCFQPSYGDATGVFFNSYRDTWFLYWLYRYAFSSTNGIKRIRPQKIINQIIKPGLMFMNATPYSNQTDKKEGFTLSFPYLGWEDGNNGYATAGLALPDIKVALVFCEEEEGSTLDSITYNETVRFNPCNLTWTQMNADGVERVPGGAGSSGVSIFNHYGATTPCAEEEWIIPTAAETKERFRNQFPEDWSLKDLNGCHALVGTISLTPTWMQFFVSKGKEIWCYWELSWGYQSTRQRQVWESSKEWGIVWGMSSGNFLGMEYKANIY